ncbi:MAG: MotA/TolQ/ExbB proton channel family protein [Gemmatimonadota bacterium]
MQPDTSYELLTIFRDGGFMMLPLVLCSLIALGVIIAKMWTLVVAHRESQRLLEDIRSLGTGGHIGAAIQKAEETRGPVAAILLAGLMRVQGRHTGKDIEKAISTTGSIELDFLERGLVVLATIANVAPMLGFLGTVIGMISAFAAIEAAGQVEPALVASGIKVALITTAAGLTIAIPVNVFYNFFVTRVDTLIADMEKGAQAVLDLIWRSEMAA